MIPILQGKGSRFTRTGSGSLSHHPTTSPELTPLRHKPCFSINDRTTFVQYTPTPSIKPLHGSQGQLSSACPVDRSEASHRHTRIMSPTTHWGKAVSTISLGVGGGVSISPTCLDVLVQLVNEGIQLLAVLRLQLQLVTGMDPLAQGAAGPRQPGLGRRRPGSRASPPPGKLIPFLSPGYSPTDQGSPGQTPPSQSFWSPSLGPVQCSGHKVTPCHTLILKGAVAAFLSQSPPEP